MIPIEGLLACRRRQEKIIRRVVVTRIPTRHGDSRQLGTPISSTARGSSPWLPVSTGPIPGGADVLVRVQSECLPGEMPMSRRCDCGPRLDSFIQQNRSSRTGCRRVSAGHEGRGLGLVAKLQAHTPGPWLDIGYADLELGLPIDSGGVSVC